MINIRHDILGRMSRGGLIAAATTAVVAVTGGVAAATTAPSEPVDNIDTVYEGPNLTVVIDTDAADIRAFVVDHGADEISADVITSGASLNVYTDTHVYFVTVDDGTFVVAIANA